MTLPHPHPATSGGPHPEPHPDALADRRAAPRPRMLWMDIVRGAAILAVIFFHSVTVMERYGYHANDLWRHLNETLKLFRMPSLIFLSGMLLPLSLSRPGPVYLAGKLRGILWPFLVWSTIYAAVTGIDLTSPYQIRLLYTGGSHLWFLVFILVYYLLARPLRGVNPLVVAGAAFALSMLSTDGTKYSERLFFLMALFFLGAAAARHHRLVGRVLGSRLVWLLAPVVAVTAFATVRDNLNFGPSWVVPSVMGMIFFSAMAYRLQGTALARPLVWIGQRSIVFYVSHAVFIVLTAELSRAAGVQTYAAAALMAIAASLGGGWVLAVGQVRWRGLGWLFAWPAPSGRPMGQMRTRSA